MSKDFLDDKLWEEAIQKEIQLDSMKPKECCANCIHCAEVKKMPYYNTVLTNICLYFRNTEESYYILEVDKLHDRCEVFKLWEDKEELIYEINE